MKQRLKTAVIGVGNMGKNHARIYSHISNLVAVCDSNEKVGLPVAHIYNTKFYTDYMTLLTVEKPDAVSVVVPSRDHMLITVECLKKNVPTLVEKPIADTVVDAKIMLDTAIKYKTLLMVGHTERFNPAVIQLKKMITEKKLGNIVNLLAMRIGLHPPVNTDIDVAIDLAIHDIDVINFLLNEFPLRKKVVKNKVYKNSVADSSSFMLEYKKTTGIIHSNWITPAKIRKLYVSGSLGFAELDYISQQLIVYEKVTHVKKNINYLDVLGLSDSPKKMKYVSKKEPLKEELKFFLQHSNDYHYTIQSRDALKALETAIS